jgi:hypothetical protein
MNGCAVRDTRYWSTLLFFSSILLLLWQSYHSEYYMLICAMRFLLYLSIPAVYVSALRLYLTLLLRWSY